MTDAEKLYIEKVIEKIHYEEQEVERRFCRTHDCKSFMEYYQRVMNKNQAS